MLDAPSMARLKQLMAKYQPPKSSFTVDTRPASGMVGQTCEGYIQNESGKLIRIAYTGNSDDQIGPGTYDPIYPNRQNAQSFQIQKSSCHTVQDKSGRTPSPGKYNPSHTNTRIPHLISSSQTPYFQSSKYTGDGPSITHPSWIPKYNVSANSKRTKNLRLSHPSYHFQTGLSTFQFSSNTHRNIFPKRFISPSPVLHAKQEPPVEYDPNYLSPVFADKTDRFKSNNQETPSPDSYVISDTFGNSPTKIISPQSQSLQSEKDFVNKYTGSCFDNHSNFVRVNDKNHPYQPTPDPAMYAGPVIQTIDPTHHSPQFEDKIDRFKKVYSDSPPPNFYNVNTNIALAAPHHKIRSRSSLPSESWCKSHNDSPPVGSYNPHFEKTIPKSGYISSIGRKPFDIKEDRPLAFQTTHSSFLKKSYNANYMNADYNY